MAGSINPNVEVNKMILETDTGQTVTGDGTGFVGSSDTTFQAGGVNRIKGAPIYFWATSGDYYWYNNSGGTVEAQLGATTGHLNLKVGDLQTNGTSRISQNGNANLAIVNVASITSIAETINASDNTIASTLKTANQNSYKTMKWMQTSNATPTAVMTVTPNDNKDIYIKVVSIASTADHATQVAAYERWACFKKISGTVTLLSSPITIHDIYETTSTMDLTVAASGATIVVNATGVAATTINWVTWAEVYESN